VHYLLLCQQQSNHQGSATCIKRQPKILELCHRLNVLSVIAEVRAFGWVFFKHHDLSLGNIHSQKPRIAEGMQGT